MSYFFDKDDPLIVSLRDFCSKLTREDLGLGEPIPAWNKGKKGQVPWNKGLKLGKMKPESIEKRRKTITGRKLSEEHKKKIGESNKISRLGIEPWNKGKKIDSTNYRKTKCLIQCPDGTIEQVESMKDFCVKHSLSRSNMSLVVNGKQGHHKGYKLIK